MRFGTNLAIAMILALVVGLGGTWFALTYEKWVETVTAGPWRAVIEIGTARANPYARAILARTGAIPMLATESVVFRSVTDSRGEPLRGTCTYRLHGRRINARWWTLSVTDNRGQPVAANSAPDHTTSVEIMHDHNGEFDITLSAMARPGNWLATGGTARLTLSLHLYDTPIYINGELRDIVLPSIMPERCS